MANYAKGFVVIAGKRASGAPYWLVRGTKDRKQIRREFSERNDALAFAEQQSSSEALDRPVDALAMTHLGAKELRDAEVVSLHLQREFPGVDLVDLLQFYRAVSPVVSVDDARKASTALNRAHAKFSGTDLAFIADWFASNYRVSAHQISLSTALEHYLNDAQRRFDTRTLSRPQFQRIGYAMTELENHFGGDAPLSHLTVGRLSDYLKSTTKGRDGKQHSNKTWNNRRGYIGAFLTFCLHERWIEQNPVSAIRSYKKKDLPPSAPAILSLDEAREVMSYAERTQGGRLVPFLAICLFAGIRPDYRDGEISKLRDSHFHLETGDLKVSAEISKVRRARLVKLQPNLVAWLKAYPLEKYPIICRNFRKLFLKARKDLKLQHDVLRHTYCSMLVGKFRSVGDAALQAGNSEDVLWESYMSLVTQKTAEEFWAILPSDHATSR